MVREVGTPEQRRRFLSQVASGAVTGAVALTDHPRGWALDDVTMAAERAEGGWVLHGTKLGLLADAGMDEIAVIARVGEGMGAFVVPRRRPDWPPSTRSMRAGRCTPPRSTVILVPDDAPSGSPGARPPRSGSPARCTRRPLALALETVGACDALFRMVLAYVKDRKQFGVPIGSFQAVKHKTATVTRPRACPLPLLFRRRRHRRGHAHPGHRRLHGQGRQRRLSAAGVP